MTDRISRRQAITMLGGAGVGALVLGACGGEDDPVAATTTSTTPTPTTATTAGSAAAASPAAPSELTVADFAGGASCSVTPAQTEGPYYIDVDSIRRDIRDGHPGARLRLGVRVLDADGCTPVKDAVLDVWHCDAAGDYSGFGQAPKESRFLRGAQVTNADGIAEILTIYPGWYQGRTVHIHGKVQLSNRDVLTTQLYFDDALTDQVFRSAPYAARGARTTRNSDDGIFRSETTMKVTKDGDGWLGVITVGVQA